MMDSSIRILSEQTINQIAAGEVVENPASVVKELVENSLDARSSSIIIEIKRGGFQLIRVSDDGEGMGRDDLILCLDRHATSKIRDSGDLKHVTSMGFRGEALASIAAVAQVSVISSIKKDGKTLGAKVVIEGGKFKGVEETSRKGGTTVEVASLFCNVPARKKFQKSTRASQVEIFKMLTKLILAHPWIDFKLLADSELLLASIKQNKTDFSKALKGAIMSTLGSTFLEGATPIKQERNRCSLVGYIGAPRQSRANRLGQFLFINSRAVVCPQVSYALYDGYGTRLMEKRHPIFVLHLTLPPEWVDINVHPQKREVRLREELIIKDFVRHAVIKSLQREEPKAFSTNWAKMPPLEPFATHQPQLRLREEKTEELPEFSFEAETTEFPILGIFSSYLILEGGDNRIKIPQKEELYNGLLFVDLVAAEARILYEAFLSDAGSGKELQGLMIPITFELMPHEKTQLMLYIKEIQKLGIEIREFGEKCFLIDAIDPRLDVDQIQPLIFELVDVLHQLADKKHLQKEREKKLALSLCRYARSKKKGWSLVEAKQVLKQLLKTSSPYLCPKGKATICYLEHREIEKFFS